MSEYTSKTARIQESSLDCILVAEMTALAYFTIEFKGFEASQQQRWI